MSGVVLAVCTSLKKGTVKNAVEKIVLVAEHGVEGDAHAGPGDRQVSILSDEKIELMRQKGLKLKPGAFGENIVVSGLAVEEIKTGLILKIGKEAELQVTRIGKECHTRCAIYYQTGDCIMPKFGVFFKVLKGGSVRNGDLVELMSG